MTTLGEESEKCCLCDTTSKFFVLVSTSSFGPPDLDTRSSSPARHSIEFWIRRCGNVPASVESRQRFRSIFYATFSFVSSEFLLTSTSRAVRS